jgi:hypothetical protein
MDDFNESCESHETEMVENIVEVLVTLCSMRTIWTASDQDVVPHAFPPCHVTFFLLGAILLVNMERIRE